MGAQWRYPAAMSLAAQRDTSRDWLLHPWTQRGEVARAIDDLGIVYRTRRTLPLRWLARIHWELADAERRALALLDGMVWC